jgi:hypothetical protein
MRKNCETAYYSCNSALNRKIDLCDAHANFRADRVEAVLWDWVKSFLLDPEKLAGELSKYQTQRDELLAPVRQRLALVDGMITEKQKELERAVDDLIKRYSGEKVRMILAKRAEEIETAINSLERQRTALLAKLQEEAATEEQARTVQEFADRIAEGVQQADEDLPDRRRVLEAPNVTGSPAVEDGEQVLHAQCVLRATSDRLLLSPNVGI